MILRTIRHVDAFTTTPLEGNPAAVVDGDGLADDVMQRIARNQRLSETVFLLGPEDAANHAHLRIFTPTVELPFAGHPTLAAAHTLVAESLVRLRDGEALRLETRAGLIPVEVSGGEPPLYMMTQRPAEVRASGHDDAEIALWLGLQPPDVIRTERVSTGMFWLLAQVTSLDAISRMTPDLAALAAVPEAISVFCIGAHAADAEIHVRTFAPARGVAEDPVTGSSNGCIAAFIARHALIPWRNGKIRYVAEQGMEVEQPGRVHVCVSGSADAPVAHIGGYAVTVLRGDLLLPTDG